MVTWLCRLIVHATLQFHKNYIPIWCIGDYPLKWYWWIESLLRGFSKWKGMEEFICGLGVGNNRDGKWKRWVANWNCHWCKMACLLWHFDVIFLKLMSDLDPCLYWWDIAVNEDGGWFGFWILASDIRQEMVLRKMLKSVKLTVGKAIAVKNIVTGRSYAGSHVDFVFCINIMPCC